MDVAGSWPHSALALWVKLRNSVLIPLAAQAEQKGAGLVSAAASGQFVCKGAVVPGMQTSCG